MNSMPDKSAITLAVVHSENDLDKQNEEAGKEAWVQ